MQCITDAKITILGREGSLLSWCWIHYPEVGDIYSEFRLKERIETCARPVSRSHALQSDRHTTKPASLMHRASFGMVEFPGSPMPGNMIKHPRLTQEF